MKSIAIRPIAWALSGAVLAALVYHSEIVSDWEPIAAAQQQNAAQLSAPNAEPAPAELTPEELANIRVYEVANRSVVNIDTQTEQVDPFFMRRVPGQGSGSGSVIDKQGHILTNAHVIENAKEIEVTLASGKSYLAELVGKDDEHDIAVLKVDAPSDELQPLTMGRSDGLKVGQQVYTLGNPFGLEGTLTKGIISSLNRSIEGRTNQEMRSLIQTDAAMNPGNSGGPLLDSGARMIGMNVAIATRTGQNAGVGFAIPVNRIRTIVPELIEHGRIIRPDAGLTLLATDDGLKVLAVRPDGPADRAGLRAIIEVEVRQQGGVLYQRTTRNFNRGDWLVAVDGNRVESPSDFLQTMDNYQPGQTVTLTIIRDGQRQEVQMTLGEQ